MGPLGFKPFDNTGFVLYLLHGGLGSNNDIPHALTGDTGIFRNLCQGQILIVIEIKELLLPWGQKLSIEIEEHRHAVGLIFHGSPPLCKAHKLYNED